MTSSPAGSSGLAGTGMSLAQGWRQQGQQVEVRVQGVVRLEKVLRVIRVIGGMNAVSGNGTGPTITGVSASGTEKEKERERGSRHASLDVSIYQGFIPDR
jgi:hypothetical protein